jgi:hypothetical protein
MDELGDREMRREIGISRLLPRFDLVEISGQHSRAARVIAERAARKKHVAILSPESPTVYET